MATHGKPVERWWDHLESVMWAVSRAVEHWRWSIGVILFAIFTVLA